MVSESDQSWEILWTAFYVFNAWQQQWLYMAVQLRDVKSLEYSGKIKHFKLESILQVLQALSYSRAASYDRLAHSAAIQYIWSLLDVYNPTCCWQCCILFSRRHSSKSLVPLPPKEKDLNLPQIEAQCSARASACEQSLPSPVPVSLCMSIRFSPTSPKPRSIQLLMTPFGILLTWTNDPSQPNSRF